MVTDAKTASARAFVRSLNILLKLARLYGFEHSRTTEQLDTAWKELREAVPAGAEAGFPLGSTGSQLLLVCVPLDGPPPRQPFLPRLSPRRLSRYNLFPHAMP